MAQLPGMLALTEAPWGPRGPPQFDFGVSSGDPRTNLPSLLGPTSVTYEGSSIARNHSNDRCHHAYPVYLHHVEGTDPGLFHKTFVFARRDENRSGVTREMTNLVNIFELNRLLGTDEFRRRSYDPDQPVLVRELANAGDVLKLFRPLGFQVTHTEAIEQQKRRQEMEVVVAVSHKARAYNIWLSQGRYMEQGDYLWLLVVWDQTQFRVVPWSSDHSDPPSRALLHNGVAGHAIYIGRVHQFYGGADPKRFGNIARATLEAHASPNGYKEDLIKLPELEIFYTLN